MAKRDNHYEAAFEAWLRSRKIPYLAVDETKRSLAEGRSLKNLDFVVSPPALSHSWLVDVKGRRFPTGKSYWKNWVTAEELQSLASWEALFGERFSGLLVFAYNVVGDHAPLPADELFAFRGGFVWLRRHSAGSLRELGQDALSALGDGFGSDRPVPLPRSGGG